VSYNIVFVVGVGRSGTSLLHSMFAAHPSVRSLPEISFLRRLIVPGALQSVFDKNGKQSVLNALQGDKLLARTGLDLTELLPPDMGSAKNIDVTIYRNILSQGAVDETGWVVEKDPKLVEYLMLVNKLFPHSKIIHIIRDPRDVLVSKKSAEWSRGRHIWWHVFANRVQLTMGRKIGPKLFASNYHEVLYEDLILSPETVLSSLCKDIDLVFDKQMLSFGAAAKKLVSESEFSWKKETLGPLLQDNNRKWKEKLTAREIRLTEMCCKEAMLAGNYEYDTQNRIHSLVDRLWLLVGGVAIKLAALPYRFYRNRSLASACKKAA